MNAPASFPPEAVVAELEKHVLLDGFQIVIDLRKSQGCADLAYRLGMEAYGTYLPWHAFARSSTPWAIYILPVRIAEWTSDLLRASKHLPSPPPSWDRMFFTLFWVTYRHELFHWH